MNLRGITAAAPANRKESQPWTLFLAPGDIRSQSFPHESAHRPPLALGDSAQVSLQCFVDENRRAFHMLYDSICMPKPEGISIRGAIGNRGNEGFIGRSPDSPLSR